MDSGFVEIIAKYGLLPGAVLYLASLIIPKALEARTGVAAATARTDVIDMLTDRVAKLEKGQEEAWAAHEEERKRRIAAEDEVAVLKRRVASLEDQLRALGHPPV